MASPEQVTAPGRRAFLGMIGRLVAGAAALAALPAVFGRKARAEATMIDGVPHFDYRGQRQQVVEGAGALISDNAIAIVYYGSDPAVEAAARQAAAELIAQNWPVGVILADGDDTMQIYVNGQPVGSTSNPTADSGQIRDAVVHSFNRYQEAMRLTASPPDRP